MNLVNLLCVKFKQTNQICLTSLRLLIGASGGIRHPPPPASHRVPQWTLTLPVTGGCVAPFFRLAVLRVRHRPGMQGENASLNFLPPEEAVKPGWCREGRHGGEGVVMLCIRPATAGEFEPVKKS